MSYNIWKPFFEVILAVYLCTGEGSKWSDSNLKWNGDNHLDPGVR